MESNRMPTPRPPAWMILYVVAFAIGWVLNLAGIIRL